MTWWQTLLSLITGAGALDFLRVWWTGFTSHRTKKAELKNQVTVKEAVDGNNALSEFARRLEKVEARVEVLERFKTAYDTLLPLVKRLVRMIRHKQKIDPDLLDEIEAMPSGAQLMKEPA